MIGKHICDGNVLIFEHGPEPRSGQIVGALIDRKNTLKTFWFAQRARDVLAERHIPVEWLERALRVVVNTMVAPERVVSVYFDRTMKGKL